MKRRYVALLRGINVGGKNLIKMAELKKCIEAEGFQDVATYIQSGNVIFSSNQSDQRKLALQIETLFSKTFQFNSRVVVRSQKQMKEIVQYSPEGFGSDPSNYRYDVIFLRDPLTVEEAMKSVATKEGVDQAFAGRDVLYFSRLIAKAAQSYLARIITKPIYQNMTIRNWNTTVRLFEMLKD